MIEGSEILRRLLSSEIKGDLLVLFHKNPGLIDTMDGVARRIGRAATAIEAEIRDLVDLGVLRTKRIGTSKVYLLDRARDADLQEISANYVRNVRISRGT